MRFNVWKSNGNEVMSGGHGCVACAQFCTAADGTRLRIVGVYITGGLLIRRVTRDQERSKRAKMTVKKERVSVRADWQIQTFKRVAFQHALRVDIRVGTVVSGGTANCSWATRFLRVMAGTCLRLLANGRLDVQRGVRHYSAKVSVTPETHYSQSHPQSRPHELGIPFRTATWQQPPRTILLARKPGGATRDVTIECLKRLRKWDGGCRVYGDEDMLQDLQDARSLIHPLPSGKDGRMPQKLVVDPMD